MSDPDFCLIGSKSEHDSRNCLATKLRSLFCFEHIQKSSDHGFETSILFAFQYINLRFSVQLWNSHILCSTGQTRRAMYVVIIIIIIFFYGLGLFTCSGIDASPSFLRTPTISSSSRFIFEGVFRQSDVRFFKIVDPVLFLFGSHARLKETNWSSKNGGFAGGLVTLPRKKK